MNTSLFRKSLAHICSQPLDYALKVNQVLAFRFITTTGTCSGKSIDRRIWKDQLPKPGNGQAFRRIVHYPEEYTVKPLNVTNLAGRDPITGRVIAKGIGGGIKHKYHWIEWKREGPKEEGPPLEERVIQIMDDGCRTAKIALVAVADKLKYILATENMKEGDLLKTSSYIPRIAVRASEGDAYPLGALPAGTMVCCVEQYAGVGSFYIRSAGSYGKIVRKVNDKVIVKMPSKKEFSFDQHCMAVVGRISNVMHSKTPVGSAQRNRELGNRPRSGWFQRKTGRFGRKIKPLPPVRYVSGKPASPPEKIRFTHKLNI